MNPRRRAADFRVPLITDIQLALMSTLDRVAREHHVRVMDNITIADAHPEHFASYVHMTEEGNEAIAAALAEGIAASGEKPGGRVCRLLARPPRVSHDRSAIVGTLP